MIYRVTANFFFDIEDEARDFYHDCLLALLKAITINPGLPNEEHSICQWEECTHALLLRGPCVVLARDQSP